jgi:hypothetical protein
MQNAEHYTCSFTFHQTLPLTHTLFISRASSEGVHICSAYSSRTDFLQPHVFRCNSLSQIRFFQFFSVLFVTSDAVTLAEMHSASVCKQNAAVWMDSIRCLLNKAAASNYFTRICKFPIPPSSWLCTHYCFRLFCDTEAKKRKESLHYEKALISSL